MPVLCSYVEELKRNRASGSIPFLQSSSRDHIRLSFLLQFSPPSRSLRRFVRDCDRLYLKQSVRRVERVDFNNCVGGVRRREIATA